MAAGLNGEFATLALSAQRKFGFDSCLHLSIGWSQFLIPHPH
jgi:hypothetical protein